MITLETLQSELSEVILVYFNLAERMEKQGYTRAYSSLQIIELNSIINDSTKIVQLHKAMLEYLEDKLPRPFGERVRYALGIERDYDLHNNLVKVLVQAKYLPDKLDRIDERAEWDKMVDERIKNVREELLANPEVLVSEKITRLSDANIKLQKLVQQLKKDLEAAQSERDYWRVQHNIIQTKYDNLSEEKKICEKKLKTANSIINHLKAQKNQTYNNSAQQQKPNPSNFMPRKQ